jgi:hypothetical protein
MLVEESERRKTKGIKRSFDRNKECKRREAIYIEPMAPVERKFRKVETFRKEK